MRLLIGDEFRDPGPAGRTSVLDRPAYKVTGIVRETPWSGLYEGKKLFTNYHFGRRALEEAGDQEGLDVFLKTVQYRSLDDREHIKDVREQAFFEIRRVLGRGRQTRRADDSDGQVLGQPLSNLLPEPIDYLQVPNDRDVFAVSNPRQLSLYEPILVFERVHGVPLDRWLTDSPSLPRRLEVLAGLLDFLAVLHTEGLLLNGLCPEGVWLDESDRLHYLASDRVIDSARQKRQRGLFPPERYPCGYSPAEAFDPEEDVGAPTDLYNWAALAYFLITAESPAEIARQQGQRFARFTDEHFDRLQRELHKLPAGSLKRVQQAFRIAGARFVHTWPDSFVAVLRECLLPKPAQRPANREALSGLWTSARPRPIPAALAVHTGKHVELLLASRDMAPGLEMVIRRAAGFVPRHAQDGQLIAEGPLAVRALDQNPLPQSTSRTPAPQPFYAVFTRVRSDGEPVYSVAAPAPLLKLSQPDELLASAEEAAPPDGNEPLEERPILPPRLALLEELADTTPVARAWFASARPLVRRWALHLLEGQLRTPISKETALDLLLERCVAEDHSGLRKAALRIVFQGERHPAPALVARVALALGHGDIDAAVKAVRGLSALGLTDEALHAAEQALDLERPASCPECHTAVKGSRMEEHLRTQHGYVKVDGALHPYGEALRTLWRRVLVDQAESCARQLADLFSERHGERAAAAYSTALYAQLQQHAGALGPPGVESSPAPAWERLGKCLAAHELTQRVCRELLGGPDARLRQLARLALVPVVAGRLTGKSSVEELRTSLDALCAQEDLETRLAVCDRLQSAGTSPRAVAAVKKELEQERAIPCPHCQAQVRAREMADHLRSAHGIYEVNGRQLPWEAALDELAGDLFSDHPREESAELFVKVAGERLDADKVAERLAESVVATEQRRGDIPRLLAVAGLPMASDVVTRLLAGHEQLALALFVAMGEKPSLTLLERMVPLLDRQDFPVQHRRWGLETILKNGNAESGTRSRALDRFLDGLADPLLALDQLDAVKQSVGKNPLLEARRRKLRETLLPCPSCGSTLSLGQLEDHAWQEHRLVLEEGRWLGVWALIEALLRSYLRFPDDEFIARALRLANRDDPGNGLERLGRLADKLGVRHSRLPRPRWPIEGMWQQLKALAWVACALLALLGLLWLLWR